MNPDLSNPNLKPDICLNSPETAHQLGELQLQDMIQDLCPRCCIEGLPNETLGEIFDYACDWNSVLQELPWPWGYPSPVFSPIISNIPVLSIGTTCARWHALVASLPNLWSRLKLQFSARKRLPDDQFLAVLEQFLQRSGNWPLDLDVHVETGTNEEEHLGVVLARLFLHIDRWRTLKFHAPDEMWGWCPPGTKLDLPALEVLHFYPTTNHFLEVFGQTPNLQTLQLIDFSHASDPPRLINPERISCATVVATSQLLDRVSDLYPNLTNLTLIQTYCLCQRCVLSSAVPLKTIGVTSLTLIVEDSQNRTLLEAVLESFTLPSLTELSILSFANRLSKSSSKSHDGSWTSAPQLEPLRLHLLSEGCGSSYTRPWPQSLWDSFVLRSSCKLTALTLVAIPLSDITLVNIISLQPLLEDLRIEDTQLCGPRNSPITRHLISCLTLPVPGTTADHPSSSSCSQIPSLVPMLRHLTLNFGGKRFDDLAFIGMVCSRRLPVQEHAATIGVCSLRSVTIHFLRRYIMASVYRPLMELDKMGLRVIATSAKGKYEI